MYKESSAESNFQKEFNGGPAAIRTQDLPVISRTLHQTKLRALIIGCC